jgi:type IV pilus assembly protein PilV
MLMIARRHAGYTLLEVLIALLVFSIGLLGLAAMLVSAVKGNHQAYHHSQAVFVAEAMSDGMRANLEAVNADSYNTGGYITTYAGGACTVCTAPQLAARDLAAWAQMANRRLPNGAINIACDGSTPIGFGAAGYNGICTINVRWDATGDVGQSQASSQQTFTWMLQP